MDNEMRSEVYRAIKKMVSELGITLFGVANIEELKLKFPDYPEIVGEFKYGISLGIRLNDKIIESIEDKPNLLYKHHYRQANIHLDQVCFRVANYIQAEGYEALPIPASIIIDWEKQRGHLNHKIIAEGAGLGFRGRNNLLVTPQFGARIRLCTILTNLPLSCDTPKTGDCGECTKCVSACPVSAIKKEGFELSTCFELLNYFRKKEGIGVYICGICIKACKGLFSL
jgi:epoxyqueuosine reductase QueG